MTKKTKTNPSTTKLSIHIGFRCPIKIYEQAEKEWGKDKTKWIVEAIMEKLNKRKTGESNANN